MSIVDFNLRGKRYEIFENVYGDKVLTVNNQVAHVGSGDFADQTTFLIRELCDIISAESLMLATRTDENT